MVDEHLVALCGSAAQEGEQRDLLGSGGRGGEHIRIRGGGCRLRSEELAGACMQRSYLSRPAVHAGKGR